MGSKPEFIRKYQKNKAFRGAPILNWNGAGSVQSQIILQ